MLARLELESLSAIVLMPRQPLLVHGFDILAGQYQHKQQESIREIKKIIIVTLVV